MPAPIKQIEVGGTNYNIRGYFYGTCSTSYDTAAKVVVCPEFSSTDLVDSTIIAIYFDEGLSYDDSGAMTLNVNGTGAIALKTFVNGGLSTAVTFGELEGLTTICMYSSYNACWIVIAPSADYNTTYSAPTVDRIQGWTVNRYASCTTGASTSAKTANITNGTATLSSGLAVYVKFTNANTADNPTLNISSKGAKNIFYSGAQITTGNEKYLLRGLCLFVYDGTQWHLISADNPPIQSKTYTGVIGTANDWANAVFFFGSIKPTSYYALWRIKYRVYVEAAGTTESKAIADVLICGTKNTYTSYSSFNAIENTNYRPAYYHELYTCKEAGITNGYGHLLGLRLQSSWNPTTSANSRTVVYDIVATENCDIEFFDSATKYANAPGTGSTNYYSYYEIDFANNGLQETSDNNTVSTLQVASGYITNGSTLNLPAYSLFGFDRDEKIQSISLYQSGYATNGGTTSINTARVYNTTGMDWTRGLNYSNSWYQYNTNANVNISYCQAVAAVDFRYSDNCVASTSTTTSSLGIVARRFIYFRGIIKEDGLFYLQPMEVTYNSATYKRAWTQDIPTAEETVTIDGHTYQYVYWLIGLPYYSSDSYAYNMYYINLDQDNKMYWYNNGRFEEYNTNKTKITIVDWSVS